MVIQRLDRFGDSVSLREAMDKLFEQSVVRPRREGAQSSASVRSMPVDLYETDNDYVIRAYVPGVKAEDVDINAERDSILIKAHVPGEAEREEAKGYRWMMGELGFGDVVRGLNLPTPIEAGKIEASVENGILTVVVPKAEEAKPKKIAVKAK